MTDYKRKVSYLNKYVIAKSHIDTATDELSEIYDLQVKCDFTGLPSPHNGTDAVFNSIETIERKAESVQGEIAALVALRETIRKEILQIKNMQLRQVLFYKYILGLSWKGVRERMPNYSQSALYKMHNRAINILVENDKRKGAL